MTESNETASAVWVVRGSKGPILFLDGGGEKTFEKYSEASAAARLHSNETGEYCSPVRL